MLQLFKVFMSPNAPKNVEDVLLSGMITQHSQVDKFEKELQNWFNYPYILTLNSATSGLTLAIRMLNLSPTDVILATPLTCTATNFPILANNLKLAWVDVDPHTCNMDLDDLKIKITPYTKAVIFVHWGGYPIDLNKVRDIQDYTEKTFGFRLKVIEDCAHAFGAEYQNKKIGTHGNICIFSLQAIKHLTTGDGGLIFLPDKETYERAKLLRWFGIDRNARSGPGKKDFRMEDDIQEWGYKFHMNDINASIGLSNLPHINNNLKLLRNNANYYDSILKHVNGVKLLQQIPTAIPAYWLYTIKIVNKKGFIQYMKDNDVIVSQVHNRNDIHSCLKEFKAPLPMLDKLEQEMVCIPCGWWLTIHDMRRIINLIQHWCNTNISISISDSDSV